MSMSHISIRFVTLGDECNLSTSLPSVIENRGYDCYYLFPSHYMAYANKGGGAQVSPPSGLSALIQHPSSMPYSSVIVLSPDLRRRACCVNDKYRLPVYNSLLIKGSALGAQMGRRSVCPVRQKIEMLAYMLLLGQDLTLESGAMVTLNRYEDPWSPQIAF